MIFVGSVIFVGFAPASEFGANNAFHSALAI
jgi:hypothetical protein